MSKTIQLSDGTDNLLPVCAESGENNFGHYIKFSDGSLIQFGEFTAEIDQTSSSIIPFSFPAYFSNTNYVISFTISLNGCFGNVAWCGESGAYPVKNYDNTAVWIHNNYGSKLNFGVSWTAIGRWK